MPFLALLSAPENSGNYNIRIVDMNYYLHIAANEMGSLEGVARLY